MPAFPISTYTGVVVHRKNRIFISSVADELADRNVDHACILRRQDGTWAHKTTDIAVGGMVVLDKDKVTLLNMGVKGKVVEFTFPGEAIEQIDEGADGPSDLVHLKCARDCAGLIYAAGMARRVYRREGPGVWKAVDAGVFVPRAERTRASGFLSVDAFQRDDLCAVGLGGEIWRRRGEEWKRDASPTDATLHVVRCIDEKTAYAAGASGVVLRYVDGSWSALGHGATKDDFWGLACLDGQVYVSSRSGIFAIRGSELTPVDRKLPNASTMYLDAKDGVMWSVGEKDLAFTENGRDWTRVDPPT